MFTVRNVVMFSQASVILFTGGGGCIPACTGADTPPTVTAADGTHPTGMHYCYWMQMNCVRNCNYSVFTVFKVSHPHCGPQPHDILTGVCVQHPATFTHNTQHQKTQSRIDCTEQMPTPGENLKCQKSHRCN